MGKRRKRRRRSGKNGPRIVFALLFASAVVLLAYKVITEGRDETKESRSEPSYSYAQNVQKVPVTKPVHRTEEEVLEKLKELAEENTTIRAIIDEPSRYPQEMLASLANNPEMADFVYGYPGDDAPKAEFTEAEKAEPYPLLLQWDPRWGYESYGDGIIGMTGCGPTCLSMVLIALTGDWQLSPDVLADYGMKNGYYVDSVGTSWSFMSDVPLHFGLTVETPVFSETGFCNVLQNGGMLILAVGEGDFSTAGHFIVLYEYENGAFRVNDPNSVARSQKSWSFAELEPQIKNIWAYYADGRY